MAGEIRDPVEYYFAQGNVFLLPSAYLYGRDRQGVYKASAIALTVCEAFAAEAYLKSLIKMESGEDAPEKHNLKLLFGLLERDTQQAIRRDWLRGHSATVLNIDHGDGFKKVKTFEEALDLSAETFVKFRYNLKEHIGWHMRALGYLVRRQILKRKPEWKPVAGSRFSLIDPHPDFVKPKPQQPNWASVGGSVFNHQSPTFKIKVRGGPYANNGGTS